MKRKVISTLFISLVMLTLAGCAIDEDKTQANENNIEESSEATQKLGMASGTLIEGTQYRDYYYADKINGKYVKLKAKNNGNTDVHLSINGESEITVPPGKEDITQLEVTDEEEKYEFWVRTDSGSVSVEYKVFQEN